MTTPSQDLIVCKGCGETGLPHKTIRLYCVPCGKKRASARTQRHRDKLKATPRFSNCNVCGETFDVSIQGKSWICPSCNSNYMKEYRSKPENKEVSNLKSREYRATLADAYRERMSKRYHENIAKMTEEELQAFRKKECEKAKKRNEALRKEVFNAYGGYKCACCGETEPVFLSIDHINNDGAEMKRNGEYEKSGTSFYQYLRKNSFPEGYQVLCMNCNVGKHRNGGICPHQSNKV